jgi:hypothetical protein
MIHAKIITTIQDIFKIFRCHCDKRGVSKDMLKILIALLTLTKEFRLSEICNHLWIKHTRVINT